jgi:hypothetical protein
MNGKCLHCGGRLLEKHEEFLAKQGKTVKVLHLRCVGCGKYTTREIEQ